VGTAATTNAGILTAGLLVLTASRFGLLADFGFFMALAIALSVLTELVLTPALFGAFPSLLAPRNSLAGKSDRPV
jgi:predicted RND superfamily exporter protein